MPETFELSELLKYVCSVTKKYQCPIVIPSELGEMVDSVNDALDKLLESGYNDPEVLPKDVLDELFKYWDTVASTHENYRNNVQYYFSGNTTEILANDAIEMLTNWYDQVQIGVKRAMKIGSKGTDANGTSGVPPSYFSYNVTKWVKTKNKNAKGLPRGDMDPPEAKEGYEVDDDMKAEDDVLKVRIHIHYNLVDCVSLAFLFCSFLMRLDH